MHERAYTLTPHAATELYYLYGRVFLPIHASIVSQVIHARYIVDFTAHKLSFCIMPAGFQWRSDGRSVGSDVVGQRRVSRSRVKSLVLLQEMTGSWSDSGFHTRVSVCSCLRVLLYRRKKTSSCANCRRRWRWRTPTGRRLSSNSNPGTPTRQRLEHSGAPPHVLTSNVQRYERRGAMGSGCFEMPSVIGSGDVVEDTAIGRNLSRIHRRGQRLTPPCGRSSGVIMSVFPPLTLTWTAPQHPCRENMLRKNFEAQLREARAGSQESTKAAVASEAVQTRSRNARSKVTPQPSSGDAAKRATLKTPSNGSTSPPKPGAGGGNSNCPGNPGTAPSPEG